LKQNLTSRQALTALLLFTFFLSITAVSPDERVARILATHLEPTSKVRRTSSQKIYKTRFDNVTWDNENWRITTTNLDQGHYQSRPTVANGYIGINVAAAGPFFELDAPQYGDVINGWPLESRRQTFATISGFWDSQPTFNKTNYEWLNQYGWESAISGVPHWSGLIVDLGNGQYLDATVDKKTVSGFSSTLDAKGGITTWKYTWEPKGGVSLKVSYTMFAHKLFPTLAVVQMQITPSKDCKATIVNVIDGYSAVRTDFAESGTDGLSIFSAVRPKGIHNVTAYFYATMVGSDEVDESSLKIVKNKPYIHTNASSIAQGASADLKAGKTTTVTKYVGGASSDAFVHAKAVAKAGSMSGMKMGYRNALETHVKEWTNVLRDDTVDSFADPKTGALPDDPYIIEAQLTAVINPYYLLQNTVSKNALKAVANAPINRNSITVGGLGSDSYAGMVFWDADFWMQPGLLAAFPDHAETITNYRIDRYPQAKANAQTAYQSSKNKTHISEDAAIYSWTSARFGNCTGTGACWDYQYHVNGDIGLSMSNYWVVTGDTDTFKETMFPVYHSIATMYSEVLVKNGSRWSLTNMSDPVSTLANIRPRLTLQGRIRESC
jgi:trehalose/maltose hydrolase-like predicted phosphorylase